MLLSGVVYHLSFIKWFFSIETQKSSICQVFYDDFYINRFVNYLQDQVIRKYLLSLERLFAWPEDAHESIPAQKLQRSLARKSQNSFGNLLWKFKINCSYKKLNREEMFFTVMMKNPQTQVNMNRWIYIVTIVCFGRSSLRQIS